MAFADVLPIDEELLLKISSAFGGGFAKTRNLCGAVAGIGMVLGVLKDTLGNVADDKKDIYQKVRSLTDQFEEMNSSLWRTFEKYEEYYKRLCSVRKNS